MLIRSGQWLAVIGATIGISLQACDQKRDHAPHPSAKVVDAMVPVSDAGEVRDAGIAAHLLDAGNDSSMVAHVDSSGRDPAVAEKLCTGAPDPIAFGVMFAPGGGISVRGSAFQRWIPVFYLTLDCRLYLTPDAWHDLRSRVLSEAEVRVLIDKLHLDRWNELGDSYCSNAYDTPGRNIWYRGHAITERSCFGTALPDWFVSAFATFLNEIAAAEYENATPTPDHSLWFTLARSDSSRPDNPEFRNATTWVWGDPSEIAPEDLKTEPQIKFAQGPMADEVRVLRDDWLAGKVGQKAADFIPVLSSDGTRYELRIRGATPLDEPDGTLRFR